MNQWYDHAFGDWYPKLYPHRNLAEAARAISSLEDWLPRTGTLLDAGCGQGRHLRVLLERGRAVVGIDRSFPLLRRGVQTPGLRDRLIRADMRSLPFSPGSFSGVLSMFTSFGYFGSRKAHLDLLRELGRVTDSDGVLVLDYLNAVRVRKTLVPSSRRMVEDREVLEDRSIVERGGEELVIKDIRIRNEAGVVEARFHEEVSLYDRDPLLEMVEHAGWRVLDTRGDYEGSPWTSDSERFLVHARKGGAS